MGRIKKPITKRQLETAYLMWRKGKNINDICKSIKITKSKYGHERKIFHEYYKQREAEDRRKNIARRAAGETPIRIKPKKREYHNKKIKADDLPLDKIHTYTLLGLNKDEIAKMLGICRTTFYNYMKESPILTATIENARIEAAGDVVKSLLNSCHDHHAKDTVHASFEGEITTRKVDRLVKGNHNAQRYYLENVLRGKWTSKPEPEKTNNKGSILKTLDQLMSLETEPKDEE